MKAENIKKRILFLMQVPPPTHGASLMNNYVLNSTIIARSYETKIISYKFAKTIEELGLVSVKKILQMFFVMIDLISQLIIYKPNIVYFPIATFGPAFYRDAFFILITKIFRKKTLIHLHGKGICINHKRSIINHYLFKLIFSNSNVICLSNKLVYDINDVFSGLPYIVNNGIPLAQINLNKNDSSIPKILYVSNLDKSKGILDLVEAAKILYDKKNEFQLDIIGSSSKIITVEMLMKIVDDNYLSNCVNVLGPLYGQEKNYYFSQADIFVFPTSYETFGLVNLEAMQYRLPVVSTFEGAIPEIVDDGITGFLVEKNNPIQLADKIEVLINNPDLRKQMGEAGRKKFLEKYTLEVFEQNMKNVFDDILKKSK